MRRRLPHAVLIVTVGIAVAIAGARSTDALDARYFDKTANPCRDFFQYANGGWLRGAPIPADYGAWGVDQEINQRNLAILHRIAENAAEHPGDPGSPTQLVGDFYAAAMDQAAIERSGLAPVRTELDEVASLKSADDVAGLIRTWQSRGIDVVFELQAQEDLEHSDTNIAYAGQGGLGLPDRDDYLREDARAALLRARYRKHVEQILALAGDANARVEADWVIALETSLARASLDPLALRDPLNSYHVHSLADADAATPHFSWTALFAAAGRPDVQRFSLAQPGFFAAVDTALANVPLAHWQAYLRWHLVDDAAPYLGSRFVAADFDFRGRTLLGVRTQKPRWKRVIASIDAAIGEALGQAYVAEVLPPRARQRALELVGNLRAALRARLEHLDWMSAPTRQAALAKLDALGAKIGYPDHWRDYSKLRIARDSYYANVRAAVAFEARRRFAKFDRAVDRDEWDMTPQTVNAYNNPMRNEIVFPAAQLLPPYFDADADDAQNYGAIGAVIGHEMLHAFDDQGRKFDASGNLRDWWSEADRARFDARAAALARQFDAYVPVDSLHVNGRLTLGENIADLGGLQVAWDAFKSTEEGRSQTPIDGLTPDQRFFVAYARSWRELQRPEQLRRQLQSNEHAPARYRVDGPLGNMRQFAQAFACKAGDAMVRTDAADVNIF
jgi:putative endopeptidase